MHFMDAKVRHFFLWDFSSPLMSLYVVPRFFLFFFLFLFSLTDIPQKRNLEPGWSSPESSSCSMLKHFADHINLFQEPNNQKSKKKMDQSRRRERSKYGYLNPANSTLFILSIHISGQSKRRQVKQKPTMDAFRIQTGWRDQKMLCIRYRQVSIGKWHIWLWVYMVKYKWFWKSRLPAHLLLNVSGFNVGKLKFCLQKCHKACEMLIHYEDVTLWQTAFWCPFSGSGVNQKDISLCAPVPL